MRISDWSSDVCSSDLVPPPHAVDLPGPLCQPQSALAGEGHRRRADPGLRPRAERPGGARPGRRAAAAGDRKSVVEGKRVSVRLDLGGRRIIKKKRTTQKISQHSIIKQIIKINK